MATFLNPSAQMWICHHEADPIVNAFHKQLAGYAETPLHSLDAAAKQLGVARVLVKNESNRFGLPSFKILGASYGVFRAVAARCGLSPTASLDEVCSKAIEIGITLITCTDGNWGRAVARVAKDMNIPVAVYVPKNMDQATQEKIAGEGAVVEVVDGSYDEAVQTVIDNGKETGSLLVMDHSWEGYSDIPTAGSLPLLARLWLTGFSGL